MDTGTAIRRLQLHTTYVDDGDDAADGEIEALLRSVLAALPDEEQRAVLRHAYWRMPGVPTAALHAVGGGEGSLRRLVGRGPVVGSCPSCRRVVRARSRDDVDLGSSGPCAECRVSRPPTAAGRGARPGFTWEFDTVPQPWRPSPLAHVAAGDRRWTEHYPRTDPA